MERWPGGDLDKTETKRPGPDHQRLDVFEGVWNTDGTIIGDTPEKSEHFKATDTYEWMPGRFFLLHHVEATVGGNEIRALEVIGVDSEAGGYVTHSFDNQGASNSYKALLRGRDWAIDGESERFRGAFSEDGNRLAGRWERREDGAAWMPWLDITLTKAT